MNIIIPFEEKVSFSSIINEITSISLEHEITKNEDVILGNFLVTGSYKEYELSMNTKDFNYVIPFEINLTKKVDPSSLEVLIDNFTYELDGKDLILKIDLGVTGDDRVETVFETPEVIEEDPLELIEEAKEERIEIFPEEEITPSVINNMPSLEEDYFTYHVHLIKEGETIENICAFYNTSKDYLSSINGITEFKIGDKILVPNKNE